MSGSIVADSHVKDQKSELQKKFDTISNSISMRQCRLTLEVNMMGSDGFLLFPVNFTGPNQVPMLDSHHLRRRIVVFYLAFLRFYNYGTLFPVVRLALGVHLYHYWPLYFLE